MHLDLWQKWTRDRNDITSLYEHNAIGSKYLIGGWTIHVGRGVSQVNGNHGRYQSECHIILLTIDYSKVFTISSESNAGSVPHGYCTISIPYGFRHA